MQQAARISDYTAFFLQEVAGEPATLIEYGQTDAIFTSPCLLYTSRVVTKLLSQVAGVTYINVRSPGNYTFRNAPTS